MIVGKVAAEKGSLNMRAKASDKSKVVTTIPNGTCILVTEEGPDWCQVQWNDRVGYCKTAFLVMFREADPGLLDYRVLSKGDKGDDVLALKARLQKLGYIRSGAKLTEVYNDKLVERLMIFQRQTGMAEDGIASQEVQAYLFSDRAPACTETLPRPKRTQAATGQCECCNFT